MKSCSNTLEEGEGEGFEKEIQRTKEAATQHFFFFRSLKRYNLFLKKEAIYLLNACVQQSSRASGHIQSLSFYYHNQRKAIAVASAS